MNIHQIEVILSGKTVGHIAINRDGLCVFEYSPEWLAKGFSISPFDLPLKPGVFEARRHPFGGGFGVFDDSLPDGWGLLILDRYLQNKGVKPRDLTLLERLALVGSTGRGGLEFRPDRSVTSEKDYSDFERLAHEAIKILESDNYTTLSVNELYRRGGSPGGARPKIFTRYNDKEWIVKFRALHDHANIGQEEYEYSLLAKKCGVEMPETQLFDERYFGAVRFDRTPDGKKIHVVSMAGLTGADYRIPCIDYEHIFKVCAMLTHSVAEMWKIFRLMAFNLLIDNKDDHAKNFAFVHIDGKWQFAPAFDLLPSEGINGFRTTSINDNITPGKDDCIALAAKVGLDRKEAAGIFDDIAATIKASGMRK